ncbi:Uncharacterized protein BP5553_02697 [Venustampulla echinocandica]|uniref:NTF2-like protein n=1 Tax=Venustampulla echinocandica TaxID=2656787 RepID=A0A370TS49_9HELO|nr:Uncharacterized protein BP5553_02697 [Venustampulla echinocandica]RDL38357.1 Uncharacterized protein BP5553_02697 [Venustampulla echinocandica]
MALQSTYERFLASPNPALLADNASLHYITTLTTVTSAGEIIKHLNNQTHELAKREQKVLSAVEGTDSLAVEIHTTIEFLTGGGAYLPKLDDNFLADRLATLPIIHIVAFDANGQILQIRQSWDQGSLLKLIDVIGSTGRNWPILDGKDHIKLINSSVKSAGTSPAGGASNSNADDQGPRSRGDSTNITRDPHATLSLFAPREKNGQDALPAVVAPRASAKPPPREYSELFVGGYTEDALPNRTKASAREPSESPPRAIASKVGAGKNYSPSRIFDVDPEEESSAAVKNHSAAHLYRANPKKYQHFDFGDGSEEPEETPRQRPLKAVKSSKHGSQWGFDDFNTPAKVVPTKSLRTNDVRHWGNSDDEVMDSPIKAKKVDKPRPTLEHNFEFVDDGTPEGDRRQTGRPRGAGQNTGLGLYKNNLYDDENGGAIGEEAKQQVTIANVKDRRKDFDPHFAMTDDSPSGTPLPGKNFASGDKEPLAEAPDAESNKQKPQGINIAGDGMGGRMGTGRQWGFGDDSDGEQTGGVNKPSKYKTGKTYGKGQGSGGDFWDF